MGGAGTAGWSKGFMRDCMQGTGLDVRKVWRRVGHGLVRVRLRGSSCVRKARQRATMLTLCSLLTACAKLAPVYFRVGTQLQT